MTTTPNTYNQLKDFKAPDFLISKLLANKEFSSQEEIITAFEELKKFMWLGHLSHKNGKSFPMYSKKIDSIWHQFILFTREYITFCNQFFGIYIHHSPEVPHLSSVQEDKDTMIKQAAKKRKELLDEVHYFKSLYEENFGEVHELWGLTNTRFSTKRKLPNVEKLQNVAASIALSVFIQNPLAANELKPVYTAETLINAGITAVPKSGQMKIPTSYMRELIESSKADGLLVNIVKIDENYVEFQLNAKSKNSQIFDLEDTEKTTIGTLSRECIDPIEQCETPKLIRNDSFLTIAKACKLDPVEQCEISRHIKADSFVNIAKACKLDPVEQCEISRHIKADSFVNTAKACKLDPVEQCEVTRALNIELNQLK